MSKPVTIRAKRDNIEPVLRLIAFMVMPHFGLLPTMRTLVERGGPHVASLYCMRNGQSCGNLQGRFFELSLIGLFCVCLAFFGLPIFYESPGLSGLTFWRVEIFPDAEFSQGIIQLTKVRRPAFFTSFVATRGFIMTFLTLIVPTVLTVFISGKFIKWFQCLAVRASLRYDLLRHGCFSCKQLCSERPLPTTYRRVARFIDLNPTSNIFILQAEKRGVL